jgi:TRAP-type mannitol/chloroaromatic compound transport system substrate-binding protein
LELLADRVREASNGRLDLTIYPMGEIVPRNECTPSVKDGILDLATIATSMDMGRLGPATYIMTSSGLPAGPSTIDCVEWLYQGDGISVLNDAYSDYCYVIGAASGAAELFCHANKPLETAADFKGLKFRALGLWGELLAKHYEASVVELPGDELYSAMERGVIDAFEYGPPETNWAQGFQEIGDYIGLPGVQSPGYAKPVLVNKQWFDKLPADLQELLRNESAAMCLESYGRIRYESALAMEKFKAYGTKICYVSDEFQRDIAAKSRAMCEGFAAEDALFNTVWQHQLAFFKVWRSTSPITPAYTIFD